jgi:5-methyltetrahydrofolate--homocysteine methyltransferase
MSILDRLNHEWIFFDGGTGSVLQSMGLTPGELPETWNLTHREEVISLHLGYLNARCTIFNTNTFGANRLRFPDNLEVIVHAAVENAIEARKRARRESDAYIALDIGPTGKLLEPLGDLPFEETVSLYKEVISIGASAGADLVLIETMNDSYEAKAAVLAAKEACDLPVFATVVFDEKGKMLTGGTPESITAMLEGLRVDALGVNCSLGPKEMLPIAERFTKCSSTPIIINPNAGIPRSVNGKTVYDVDSELFSDIAVELASLGIQGIGGCCGTTPEYIQKVRDKVSRLPFRPIERKRRTVISSFSRCVEIGPRPVIIGERINPTGKKRFKEALKTGDIDYILSQGLAQEDAGADVLDVNVGLPEIDEPAMMTQVVKSLQAVTALPLQIDTSNPEAMERALRLYNGKAMINSVNAKKESCEMVFPLVRKYGGIAPTAEGRIAAAKKIYAEAEKYGIPKEDIIIDGLAMTVSSDPSSANVTLETIRRVRDELGGHSILGVSNISFGLPAREILNSSFFTMAMQAGLSCAIINPNSAPMMRAFRAYLALTGKDSNFQGFIGAYAEFKKTRELYAADLAREAAAEQALKAVPAGLTGGEAGAGHGNAGNGSVGGDNGAASRNASGSVNGTASGNGVSTGNANASGTKTFAGAAKDAADRPLFEAIRRGVAGKAAEETRRALQSQAPLDVVNENLIPALDVVGKGFEQGTLFLPQLLMAAEAAQASFEVIRDAMSGSPRVLKGKVILATVKGDIHDIGKNIVKVLLENYGYEVLDLGRDVPPERIVETAIREDVPVVGLSALMTTTVVNMEETIRQLREKKPDTKIVVGGAVMTQEYADQIGADCYGKDAMTTVRFCDQVFGN